MIQKTGPAAKQFAEPKGFMLCGRSWKSSGEDKMIPAMVRIIN